MESDFKSRKAECAALFHIATGRKQAWFFQQINDTDFASNDTKACFDRLRTAYSNGNPLRGHSAVATAVAPYAAEMGSSMGNVETVVSTLRLMSRRRAVSEAANKAMFEISDFTKSAEDLEASLREICTSASDDRMSMGGEVSVKDAVVEVMDSVEQARTGNVKTISTGIGRLDVFQTYEKGNLVIIGARPSVGKTAIAITKAVGQIKRGHKVGFICSEMTRKEIARRFLSQVSGIPYLDLRDGKIDNWMPEYEAGINELKQWHDEGLLKLSVGDSMMTAATATDLVKKWSTESDIEIVYIDYLQRLQPIDRRDGTVESIERSAKTLKNAAKDLDVVVILMAQLNRDSESRTNVPQRPRLRHLKGSSAIEQEADIVLLMYRPEREMDENPDGNTAWPALAESDGSKSIIGVGRAAIFADKNRNGDTWKASLDFEKPTMTFHRSYSL